ncbi:GNAT family N-acetyltransferase [Dethiothermospora halolimnae]|uniref:GNAT family N-acetyltransferase n=1 Tax=Dethiothermospora halolimnae TaxID=3114390 RepID=UPI003CCBE4DF
MLEIKSVKDNGVNIKGAINYIHGAWGSEDSYKFYSDAIKHSSKDGKSLPQFYVMLKDNKIIGCAGLIVNDFISRHDLYPWLACLFVEEEERGKNYGKLLLEYGEKQAKKAGFENVYLTTTHDGYYEKYGWERIEDGYDPGGEASRIYKKGL